MGSPLVALLLIVNLLTCPLRCVTCEPHAASSDESECATCDCCSHCEETAPGDPEPPVDQDCGCKNCICEGAIVASSVELPPAVDTVFWFQRIHFELRSPVGSLFFIDGSSLGPVAHMFSGRDARIAYQSWQI